MNLSTDLESIFGNLPRTIVRFSEPPDGQTMRQYLDALGDQDLDLGGLGLSAKAAGGIASALGGQYPVFLATWNFQIDRDVAAVELEDYFDKAHQGEEDREFFYRTYYTDETTIDKIIDHSYHVLRDHRKDGDQAVAVAHEEPIHHLCWSFVEGDHPCMLIIARAPYSSEVHDFLRG